MMKYRQKNIIINKKGFSLLEVIIAIFVISVGMTATVKLLNVGMKESISSRDQVIAEMLAQEGLELVRNIRDTNWEKRRESNPDKKSFDGIDSGSYIIESNADPKLKPVNGDNIELRYENGIYNHTGGSNTKFSRKIFVSGSGDDPTRTVASVVIWKGGDFTGISADVNTEKCNLWNNCSFTKVVLTNWGEVPKQ